MLKPLFLTSAGLFGLLSMVFSALATHHFAHAWTTQQWMYFNTACNFQLYHAIALLVISGFRFQLAHVKVLTNISGILFIAGGLFFSLTIELSLVSHTKGLLPLAPFGGMCFIVGWFILIIAGYRWFKKAGV